MVNSNGQEETHVNTNGHNCLTVDICIDEDLIVEDSCFPVKRKTEPEPDSHHVITEPLDLNKESAKADKFNKEIKVISFVDTLIEGVSNANLVENKESVKIDKRPVTEEQPQLGVKTGDMGKVKVRGTEEKIIMVELEPYYQPGDLCM